MRCKKSLAIVFFTAVFLGAAEYIVPEEVLENLDFFKDYELFSNIEMLEGEDFGAEEDEAYLVPESSSTVSAVLSGAAFSGAGISASTGTVKISTQTGRGYEKK